MLLLVINGTTCQFFKHLAVRGAVDLLSRKEAKPGVLAESCVGPARSRGENGSSVRTTLLRGEKRTGARSAIQKNRADASAQMDYFFNMSKAEILEALPKLTPAERQEVRLKLAALDPAECGVGQ